MGGYRGFRSVATVRCSGVRVRVRVVIFDIVNYCPNPECLRSVNVSIEATVRAEVY